LFAGLKKIDDLCGSRWSSIGVLDMVYLRWSSINVMDLVHLDRSRLSSLDVLERSWLSLQWWWRTTIFRRTANSSGGLRGFGVGETNRV
jgi:hypothetical protein